ncbi:MAG: hypothetical protein VKI83_12530 [Synechococcaceae cyanobacterium]|nr:hypothetical protein [Synechococcaceae cyanobacterium]
MLPALPSPPPLRLRALAAVVSLLLLLLGGCGGLAQPPRSVLLEALALQIQLTQGAIAKTLALDPVGIPEVSRVRLERQDAIRVGEAKGLRLSGRFDWRLAGDPIRVDSPFEIVLQRGERGESWRLARPVGSAAGSAGSEADQQAWITDPLPLPGQPRS